MAMMWWRYSDRGLICVDEATEQVFQCTKQMGGYTPAGREYAITTVSANPPTKEQNAAIDAAFIEADNNPYCNTMAEVYWREQCMLNKESADKAQQVIDETVLQLESMRANSMNAFGQLATFMRRPR